MRRQFRLLRYYGDIGIDELEPAPPHDTHDALHEFYAGNILVARVAVRKMDADIPFPHSTQQSIHERVQQHIGIGMAGQTSRRRNFDTAQKEFPPALEAMYIVTVADAQI